jgi:hypothetical protein
MMNMALLVHVTIVKQYVKKGSGTYTIACCQAAYHSFQQTQR